MRVEACVCDRCKKFYEEADNTVIVVTTSNGVDIIRADICEECRNAIYDFFERRLAAPEKKRGRKTTVNDEIREKIIALKNSGIATKEIAETTGLSISTCNRICRESRPQIPIIEIDRGKVKALWKAKRSVEWIADDIGADIKDIENIIKSFNE